MHAVAHVLLAACAVSLASPLSAQPEYEPVATWYFGPLGGYLMADAARDAEDGLNAQVVAGVTLLDALAIELTGFGSEISRESDKDKHDYLYGGGIDVVLGAPAPGNPLFLFGGGAVQQDIATVKKTNTYGELGLGLYLPYSMFGELWRLEGRYQVVFNDHPAVPDQELLEDGRINFGVLFAFGGRDAYEDVATAGDEAALAGEEPPGAAQAAGADSDGDGVVDDVDKCPDTPAWVRTDASGCAPDTDGDGIDDPRDACPATPAGAAVDPSGCPPAVAPAVAPAPLATPPDQDKDGVADATDACPHTVPRFDVDDKGCVRPENVTIRNVHFDVLSSRLTGDGYALLRQVAAAMQLDKATRYEVGGHADVTGPTKLNNDLARARAEVVRDFLTYLGVGEDRLTVVSYGETKPIASNDTPEGRAANRRVQFRRLDGN